MLEPSIKEFVLPEPLLPEPTQQERSKAQEDFVQHLPRQASLQDIPSSLLDICPSASHEVSICLLDIDTFQEVVYFQGLYVNCI